MSKILVVILCAASIYRIDAEQCGINTGGAIIQQLTDIDTSTNSSMEGLFYDPDLKKLLFVNHFKPTLYEIDGKTYAVSSTPIPDVKYISAAIPIKGNKNEMVGLADNSMISLKLQKDSKGNTINITTQQIEVIESKKDYTFTYSQVDKTGRIWIELSTNFHGNGEGELLVVQKDRSVNILNSNNTLPVGIGFNSDNTEFYYVDSVENIVTKYKLNSKAGTISEPTVVYNLTQEMNVKACICSIEVAKNGDLWLGICEVGLIINFSPKTKITNQIYQLPAKYPVGLEIGDPKMNTIFVGTHNQKPKEDTPAAGNVFAIIGTGTQGVPSNKVLP